MRRKIVWYEEPFTPPLTTKNDLLLEWQSILQQEDIHVSHKVLSVSNDTAIAHWHATFISLPTKENVELDGIFQVTLDKQGKCTEFRQWYNTKE